MAKPYIHILLDEYYREIERSTHLARIVKAQGLNPGSKIKTEEVKP